MKKNFEQRLKELERKSEFYDLAAGRVVIDCDLKEEVNDIWLEHELKELKEKVGTSESTHKFITSGLFVSSVLVLFHLLLSYQRRD